MRVNIDQLSNEAYVWIFGISPALDTEKSAAMLDQVNGFLESWASHGAPIPGAAAVQEGSFLIVAADERRDKSGCSIDRLFGTLRQLERDLGVAIIDSSRVFFRDGDAVQAVDRAGFGKEATAETMVYDVTVERLGDVRAGTWVKPAAASWHRQLLATSN